jgi:RNA-directed DNA polymerase
MPISSKPLGTLFDAMFHGKRSFIDFLRTVSKDDLGKVQFLKGDKHRQYINPDERMRAYHDFLKLFLVDFLPVDTESVYSYRKGVSSLAAVQRHAQNRHFFVTDFESFFPSLTREVIHETVISASSNVPIADLSDNLEHILDLLCVDGSLPIGFSTSPGLSNAALYKFDVELNARCKEIGVVYTRYADDIILSSSEPIPVKTSEMMLNSLLESTFGGALRLHKRKSKYLRVGGKIKFLGMVLLPNGAISVDKTIKDEVETLLYLYLQNRERFNQMREVGPAKTEARLAGLINYINTVDKDYLEKLRRKYGAAIVEMFLHRSFG